MSVLSSLIEYSRLIAEIPDTYPLVQLSALSLWPIDSGRAVLKGEIRFAHDDPAIAPTFPHHKHIPPDIKHNRLPAPGLSFTEPNLPFLIDEIGKLFS